MSEIVLVLQSLISSIFVAHTIGSRGMEVYGAIFAVEFIATALSRYILDSVELRFSCIFGEGRHKDCDQLFVDFFRVCILFGIATPFIVLPITRPIVELFGADKSLSQLCYQYMIPSTCGSFFNYIYMACCGLIESEGRSYLYAGVQIAYFILNVGLSYISLYILKLPIWGASGAIIISQIIPAVILTAVIFAGKLSIHPKMSMFFKKFSPDLCPALQMGLSNLISELSEVIPTLLMQYYFFASAKSIGVYDVVTQTWASVERLYEVVGCICNGFTNALGPSASYAFGAKRLNRLFWLLMHMLWLSTIIVGGIAAVMIVWPEEISKIWSTDPDYLYWIRKTLPIVFYAIPLIPFLYAVPAVLASTHRILASVILAIVTLIIPYPIFSTLLYYSNKHDPARIMYTYTLSDVFSFFVGLISIWPALRDMWRAPADPDCPLLSQPYIEIK